MTAADHATEPTNDAATAPLAELKARYPNVREPILMALHILLQDANISLEEAKAKAKAQGIRITAASVAAAQRLLSRMDQVPPAPPALAALSAPTRPARRPRAAEPATDAEELIRGVVAKLQSQGNAEAQRIRATISKAIELLTTALA